MGDKYTSREDMERNEREKDPCYNGHDYIETGRSTHTIKGKNKDTDIEYIGTYGWRDTGMGKTYRYRQEITTISYKCSRCGERTEEESSGLEEEY